MNPLSPGVSTTEFRITLVATIVGVVLEAGAGIIYSLEGVGVNPPWFTVALASLGALLQLVTAFGYVSARTRLKEQALKAGLVAASIIQTPRQAADVLRGPP